MRIGINALYSMSGKFGGMQIYLENILKNFFKFDNDNSYILFCNKTNYGELQFDNFNIKKVFCPVSEGLSFSKTLWEQTILPFQVSKYKIDLLFSPAYITPIIVKCKSVVTIHCTNYIHHPEEYDQPNLSILRLLIPLSVRNSDRIITVSNCIKLDIAKRLNVPENKITVIPLAPAEHFSSNEESNTEILKKHGIGKHYVLSVSSAKPNKNLKSLITAFIKIKDSSEIPHQLVLVGDKRPLSKDNWFNDCFANSRWLKDIIFTGIIPNKELSPLYRNAEVFAFISKYESFGLPILEAMSCGAPVVTSTTFALPETAGGCALLADPYSPDDIANKIKMLLNDDNLRSHLSDIGKKHSKQFSWEKTAKETINVFREIYNNQQN